MQVEYLARSVNHLIVILVNSKNLCMCREACRDAERIALVFLLFEFEIHMVFIVYRCAVASRIIFSTFIILREEIAHEIVTRFDICCRLCNRLTAFSCGKSVLSKLMVAWHFILTNATIDCFSCKQIYICCLHLQHCPKHQHKDK